MLPEVATSAARAETLRLAFRQGGSWPYTHLGKTRPSACSGSPAMGFLKNLTTKKSSAPAEKPAVAGKAAAMAGTLPTGFSDAKDWDSSKDLSDLAKEFEEAPPPKPAHQEASQGPTSPSPIGSHRRGGSTHSDQGHLSADKKETDIKTYVWVRAPFAGPTHSHSVNFISCKHELPASPAHRSLPPSPLTDDLAARRPRDVVASSRPSTYSTSESTSTRSSVNVGYGNPPLRLPCRGRENASRLRSRSRRVRVCAAI